MSRALTQYVKDLSHRLDVIEKRLNELEKSHTTWVDALADAQFEKSVPSEKRGPGRPRKEQNLNA